MKKLQADYLPISVWYSGGKARAPMLSEINENSRREWLADLEHIKNIGFNTVRTWVEWAKCEPEEGKFNFENLKLLSELANDTGLKVIIQVYADSAPDWVGRKYPDSLYEAQSGAKIPSQAAPGFCSDNEGVCSAVEKFYAEAAKAATQYPNFFGWDLWSEPHIVNWVVINFIPNVQFCYCPYTKKKFQKWLKEKYRTIENINKSWYRNFATWEEIEPPRFGTILSYTDFIDWKNFIYWKMADDLRIRAEAIRTVDKTHIITSHAAVPSIFYTPFVGYGATDDFLMAEQVDYYGTSIYPKHSFPDRHWELWKTQIAMDFSRSANIKNNGFFVGELQAGYGVRGMITGNPVESDDLRIWMTSALAKHARGVNFYAFYPMSSGYEAGGYGLITLDGMITDRAAEAGRIADIVTDNMDLFLKSKPVPAEIALVYSTLAQMVGGEQNCGPENGMRDSLAGYFRMFNDNNIPADFIHLKDIEDNLIEKYKLIVIPYSMMFSRKAAEVLKEYVKDGGCVVSEAHMAWNDERGHAADEIPGMGLHEVFGVVAEKSKMSDKVPMHITNFSHPVLSKLLTADILNGTYYMEFLAADAPDTQIIATFENGAPAITAHNYGKGKTIYIGTFFGLGCHQKMTLPNTQFVLNLLDWAGIEKPFNIAEVNPKDTIIEARIHQNESGYLLFLINHSIADAQISVDVRVSADGEYSIEDLLYDFSATASTQEGKLPVNCIVSKRDVRILDIRKQ